MDKETSKRLRNMVWKILNQSYGEVFRTPLYDDGKKYLTKNRFV